MGLLPLWPDLPKTVFLPGNLGGAYIAKFQNALPQLDSAFYV